MHFCTECNNMYYIKLNNNTTQELIYYCRKCGHEDNIGDKLNNLCVSKTHIKNKQKKPYTKIINEFVKLDPTLPRIKNMVCPNISCDSNLEDNPLEKDIIYMRYDDVNMKFVYICTHCNNIWTTENN